MSSLSKQMHVAGVMELETHHITEVLQIFSFCKLFIAIPIAIGLDMVYDKGKNITRKILTVNLLSPISFDQIGKKIIIVKRNWQIHFYSRFISSRHV